MWTSTSRPAPIPNRAAEPASRGRRSPLGEQATSIRRAERIAPMPAGLAKRSGGMCEIRLAGCLSRASLLHHRTRRVHGKLSAILHTCPSCGRECERDLPGARKLGLVLRGRRDPSAVKVLYRGEMALLTDAGEVVRDAAAASVMPVGSLWHRAKPTLPPWLIAGGVVGGAGLAYGVGVPWWACVAGTAVETMAVWWLSPRTLRRGRTDLTGQAQRTVGRRRRAATWTALAAGLWTTQATVAGLDPATLLGKLGWSEAAAAFALATAPWFSYVHVRPPTPAEPPPTPEAGPAVSVEEYEHLIRDAWTEKVACPGGKGAGTALKDWRRVAGGWGAAIVAPDVAGFDFMGSGLRRAIAQAFRCGITAVSLEVDTEDDSQAYLLVQKRSPLKDDIRWDGPGSINAQTGHAVIGRYSDGTREMYELYRPEWGCPHMGIFGTTGSGKSEFLNLLLTIERWAHYRDANGAPQGMVCSLLVDPQQGQSFGPFLDDLAVPVASTVDEAILLVEAVDREMLRRNAHLAGAEWVDEKGRHRKGRKWWNPLVDGPLIDLTIDEAHDYLTDPRFLRAVTRGGRMWRKCGGRVKVATHTTLLADLGGSTALKDMISQFVAVFRTNNSHTGNSAFNGRLPVDPRQIPEQPGTHYVLARGSRAMLARAAWEPDFYDWVRDASDSPVGYPATLPPETLAAFGDEVAAWAAARRAGELWVPSSAGESLKAAEKPGCREALLRVLTADWAPFGRVVEAADYSTRQCTNVLKRLVDEELAEKNDKGAYRLVDA